MRKTYTCNCNVFFPFAVLLPYALFLFGIVFILWQVYADGCRKMMVCLVLIIIVFNIVFILYLIVVNFFRNRST